MCELLKNLVNQINCTNSSIPAMISEQSVEQQALPWTLYSYRCLHINTLLIASPCQPVLFYAVLQVCPGSHYLSWTSISKDQLGGAVLSPSCHVCCGIRPECSPCVRLSIELIINSAEFANCVTVDDVFIAHLRVHSQRTEELQTRRLWGDGNWFPMLKWGSRGVTVTMPGKSRH